MSQLGELLRETSESDRTGSGRTVILGLLEDRSDGGDRARSKWRTLKRRLRLKSVGCCGGSAWNLRPTTVAVENDSDDEERMATHSGRNRVVDSLDPSPDPGLGTDSGCLLPGVTNLAEALAAERQSVTAETTAKKVPLMRLMAESDGCDSTWLGCDPVCCVCMGREKGAAMIPCGHTYCRVCSREIWVDRGTCPLCNRPIFDVLDLY
ncbi:PREDICTED: uncharacterized protein LOC104809475 [Tarenaya hassleriana]|uniref:uncharacterized protein LOC104809475 n=1 Tax=Tarenaya hassleriana TaxID=28532 RepID=UPI00053C48B3|nr:PREDICTED: uncharacterized protein LOC104809475 [Tarenaya hassleriana]